MGAFKNTVLKLLRNEKKALPCVAAAAAMSAWLVELRKAHARLLTDISGGDSKHEHEHSPELFRIPPPEHPDTICVRRIAGGIIAAACDDEVVGQLRLSERTGQAGTPDSKGTTAI